MILVRPETSPDDVAGMERAVGILTATGGFASHAAVVARGWGSPRWSGRPRCGSATDGITIGGPVARGGRGHLDRRRDGRGVRGRRVGGRDGRAGGEGAARLGARARDRDRRGGGRGRRRAAAPRRGGDLRGRRAARAARQGLRAARPAGARARRGADEAQALLDALVADGHGRGGRGRVPAHGGGPRAGGDAARRGPRRHGARTRRPRRSTRSSTSTGG